MTEKAGGKEARLFSRFLLSATVVAGDRYGSMGALLWRGCAYPGNSPSFKNGLRRCTPITLRSKPSCIQERNATKRQRHLARGVRLPCGLCSQDRQAASLPGKTVPAAKAARLSAHCLESQLLPRHARAPRSYFSHSESSHERCAILRGVR